MKKDTTHISRANLLAVIDQTMDSEGIEQAYAHLSQCAECDQSFRKIKEIRIAFSADDKLGSPAGDNCLDEEKIAAYLDGCLPQPEVQDIQQHIQTCDFCFYRQARAYKCFQQLESQKIEMVSTPSWLAEKAVSLNQASSQEVQPGWIIQVGSKIKEALQWIKGGLLTPLPGYAMAGILLFLLLSQGGGSKSQRLVNFPEATNLWVYNEVPVAYRNNKVDRNMILDESRPLYREPKFSGLEVTEKKGQGLTFAWPRMEDTQEYNFTLFSPELDGKRILVSLSTSQNKYQYSYKKFGNLNPDHLYEWEVSGNYGKGLYFKAKGSFILTNSLSIKTPLSRLVMGE